MCDLRNVSWQESGMGADLQVAGDVGEIEIVGTDELNRRALEHGIMFLAHEARVLDRLMNDVAYVCVRADDADIVLMRLERV